MGNMLWCPVAGGYIGSMGAVGGKYLLMLQFQSKQLNWIGGVECSHRFHPSDIAFLSFWSSIQYAEH